MGERAKVGEWKTVSEAGLGGEGVELVGGWFGSGGDSEAENRKSGKAESGPREGDRQFERAT